MALPGYGLTARLLTGSLLWAALFCLPGSGKCASEPPDSPPASSREDLLLFWDEKELYVQTATRSEKPINQVAENMTVITAREIELLNATSINEVLARAPGVFVDFSLNDYSASGQLHILGSEERHVTVLLDGMPINFLSGGNADTTFIPLRIVERIEIIKGAASSTWGSALGGVINIITRGTGDRPYPNGTVNVSYGEANSRNIEAGLNGKNGPVSYYLYAGNQASDGLRNHRDYRRTSLFGKLFVAPNRDVDITLSAGYSNPDTSTGEMPTFGVRGRTKEQAVFANGSFEYRATPELTLSGGLHYINSRVNSAVHILDNGELFNQNLFNEETIGANIRATLSSGIQTLTLGAEISHGTLNETTNYGLSFQSLGAPASITVSPSIDRWAAYANDTLEFGSVTVTPGIRLDHNNISGYFVSPSLGVTWELAEHCVVRASVARGFTSPPVGFSSGQGLFVLPNPKLKAEYGWSYQAGIESGLANLLSVKTMFFRHDTTKAMSLENDQNAPGYFHYANGGDVVRQGYELETETIPFHDLSLKMGHAYVHTKAEATPTDRANNSWDTYAWLIGIKYDDRRSLTAQLSGRYVWWNYVSTMPTYPDPHYSTFIWDLTATKKFQTGKGTVLETYLTIHNLFSGANYTVSLFPNASRWFEGGLRFHF